MVVMLEYATAAEPAELLNEVHLGGMPVLGGEALLRALSDP